MNSLAVPCCQPAQRATTYSASIWPPTDLSIAIFNISFALLSVGGGHVVDEMVLTDTTWFGTDIVILVLALTRLSDAMGRRDHSANAHA